MTNLVKDLNNLWSHVCGDLQRRLDRTAYRTWLRGATLVALTDDTATVQARSAHQRDRLERCEGALIAECLSARLERPIRVVITLGGDAPEGVSHSAPSGPATPAPGPSRTPPVAPVAQAHRPAAVPSAGPSAAEPPVSQDADQRRWSCALGVLQQELPRATFATWVRGARWGGLADGVATIVAGRPDQVEGLRRLVPQLERVLEGVFGQALRVVIIQDGGMPEGPSTSTAPSPRERAPLAAPAASSVVPAASSGPRETPSPALPGCPPWLAPAAWVALPPTLRAALSGARLEGDRVVASSGFFQSVVDRHEAQVRELLATAESARSA